jgi:hypothetical protein
LLVSSFRSLARFAIRVGGPAHRSAAAARRDNVKLTPDCGRGRTTLTWRGGALAGPPKESAMPRAKRKRRKHSVRASVQIHQLSKAGTSIDFQIYAEEEKIGTMIIGRGSVTWFGRNRKTPIELNWTRFAQIMDERYDD